MSPAALSRRSLFAAALAAMARAVPLSQVRLGVSTDEIDEDPNVVAPFLERLNVRYAEVRSLWGKYNTEQPIEKVKAARAVFDAHKVQVQVLDTPLFRGALPEDSAELDKDWTLLNDGMDRAEVLGARMLRIFAFRPKDGNTADRSVYPRSYELLSEAAARAARRGLKLAIENLEGSYVATGAAAADLLKALPAANIGLTWDPNNAATAGETPFPDGYKRLDPARIFNVHLRDFRHKADGSIEWAAVGAGEFDNLGQIRALLASGYKGAFTLETHYRDPRGKAFATETSLTALQKLFEKA